MAALCASGEEEGREGGGDDGRRGEEGRRVPGWDVSASNLDVFEKGISGYTSPLLLLEKLLLNRMGGRKKDVELTSGLLRTPSPLWLTLPSFFRSFASDDDGERQ